MAKMFEFSSTLGSTVGCVSSAAGLLCAAADSLAVLVLRVRFGFSSFVASSVLSLGVAALGGYTTSKAFTIALDAFITPSV